MQRLNSVLIVGAGPTGLTMAMELHRHGIPFRIIDKQQKPVPTSNALAVQSRTLEVWEDMGLLSHAFEYGHPINALNFYSKNKKLWRLSFNLLDTDYQYVFGISQHFTELMLIQQLQKNNIIIEMETELVSLKEVKNHVAVELQNKSGALETTHFNWVIACDGSHSTVREKLNIPFVGKELSQHFVFADVELVSYLSNQEAYGIVSKDGLLLLLPYDKKYWRVIADVTNDSTLNKAKSLTHEQLETLLKKRCSFNIKASAPIWTSGFWIHERLISSFRHKKIFFAGDAAHIHSPVGGQGMNTGIQDAYNLAWKLALVIKGKAKDKILDTYHAERYPVAKKILRNTTIMTKFMTIQSPFFKMIRNILLTLMMKSKNIRKKLGNEIAELSIKYSDSELVLDFLRNDKGPKAGMRMIDVKLHALSENKRLYEVVKGTCAVLLIFSGIEENVNWEAILELKKSLKAKYTDLLKFVFINSENEFAAWNGVKIYDADLALHQNYGVIKPTFYLIRPDKYIGFCGGLQHKAQLKKYLSNVFVAEAIMP